MSFSKIISNGHCKSGKDEPEVIVIEDDSSSDTEISNKPETNIGLNKYFTPWGPLPSLEKNSESSIKTLVPNKNGSNQTFAYQSKIKPNSTKENLININKPVHPPKSSTNDNKYNKFGLPPKPSFLDFSHKPESTNNLLLDNKSSIIDSSKQDPPPQLKLDDTKESSSKSNSQLPPKLLFEDTKKNDLKSNPQSSQSSTTKRFDNTKYFAKRDEMYEEFCKKTDEALDKAINSIFGDNKKSGNGSKQNLQSRPSDNSKKNVSSSISKQNSQLRLPDDSKKKDSQLRPSSKLLTEDNKNCDLKKDSQLLSFHDFMKNANSECADSKHREQDKQERIRLHREERSYRFNPYPMEMPTTMRRQINPYEIPDPFTSINEYYARFFRD
ncbi:507_t:CDS:2 [Diversispora eburnea]|uniref:507_t:CDS:1 n=1 Tax=Diversispora eburnea TaxID=1213867 RepID=A0A9N8V2C3_9GLOM|nr:507_t:CDS:2 [Diversispora eburnea]